jgi:hypothetical protein
MSRFLRGKNRALKDILLAVAARNQNQQVILAAAEQLESHISRIKDSHEQISERKKSSIGSFRPQDWG